MHQARPLLAPWVRLLPPAPEKRKRPARPGIDIDDKITDFSKDTVAAQKLLKETKTLQRNERRKKQRLITKASGLSSTDLECIEVLKRCDLWGLGHGVTFDFSAHGENPEGAAAAVGEAVAVTGAAGPSVVAIAPAVGS